MNRPPYPSKNQVSAATATVPDLVATKLKVLFCGINPGLMSSAMGFHFARPGNRFWPAIHLAGYTDRILHPSEESELIPRGYGITNIVRRPSANAEELTREELLSGGEDLRLRVLELQPRILAMLGVTAYRTAFRQPKAVVGLQDLLIGDTKIWVVPNPSGLNAHYMLGDLAKLYEEVRLAAEINSFSD